MTPTPITQNQWKKVLKALYYSASSGFAGGFMLALAGVFQAGMQNLSHALITAVVVGGVVGALNSLVIYLKTNKENKKMERISAEQPTTEIDPLEITMAYLEKQREDWLPLYHRSERAGRMNAEANRNASDAFKPIDRLLDEFNRIKLAQTVELGNGQGLA